MRKRGLVLIVFLILSLCPLFIHVTVEPVDAQEPERNGSIDFQPSIMDDITFSYDKENHWFELSYEQYYMRFRPFAIYNNTVYTQRQIVQLLRNRGATYNEVITTVRKALHWGFNITGIPQDIQENLDYLGFKLTDYNFPLSIIELNEQFIVDDERNYTITTFSIPKINFRYSFQDLQELGYTVDIINKTYLLIGNVKNRENLLIDPITYSSPNIAMSGFTEIAPCMFWDLWNASNVNGWNAVFKQGSGQYLMNCTLTVGNDTDESWFISTEEQVEWMDGVISANWQNMVWVYQYGHFRLGEEYGTRKHGRRGSAMLYNEQTFSFDVLEADDVTPNEAECGLYGSFFVRNSSKIAQIRSTGSTSTPFEVYSCRFNGVSFDTCITDMNELQIIESGGNGIFRSSGNFTNIIIQGVSYGIGFQSATGTVYNMSLYNNTYDVRAQNQGGNITLVNCISDDWVIRFLNYNWANSTVNRDYTFDLNVTMSDGTPIENAEIRLYRNATGDAFEQQVFEIDTFANGTIGQQIIEMGYCNGSVAGSSTGTWHYWNPFRLEIRVDDYYIYNHTFTLTNAIDWRISMISLYTTLTSTVNVEGTDLTPLVIFFVCGLCIALSLIGFAVPFVSFIALILSLFILVPIPLSTVAYLLALQVGTIMFCSALLIIVLLRRNAQLDDEERERVPAYRRR